jgi:hypothetical protein
LFGFLKVELILVPKLIILETKIVAFDFRIDFYAQFFCSTHFCTNMSIHKSFYLQINFG